MYHNLAQQIQVMLDDQRNRSGLFETGVRGSVPPLVTTEFTVADQGHASPRFLRSTMYSVPATNDMLKQSHLPFVINISPFAKLDPKEVSSFYSIVFAHYCRWVRC